MIFIRGEAEKRIRSEGENAYPNECCGMLLGDIDEAGRREVVEVLPVRNGREAGEQYHRFVIEPDDFLAGEHAARKKGLGVIGFYHSHPDHPPVPSDYDREHALPWYSYVILGVEHGRAGIVSSWELAADRSKFTREL
jgi:proteasome lid subunit RPN8/RPN11